MSVPIDRESIQIAPTPTPYERLLLSFSFCAKASTFLLIDDNELVSQADLARRFKSLYTGTPLDDFGRKVAPGYALESLVPNGLVRHQPGNRRSDFGGFEKTDFGIEFGIPAALLALSYEFMYDVCLNSQLGQATRADSGDNSPFNRSNILNFLASQEAPVRKQDVVDQFSVIASKVAGQLFQMEKNGLVRYDHASPHKKDDIITYTRGDLNQEDIQPFTNPVNGSRYVQLTNDVVDAVNRVLEQGDEMTISTIVDKLPAIYQTQDHRRGRVSNILSDLSRQGFLNRGDFRGGDTMSRLTITPSGLNLVREFLNPLQSISENPNYFEEAYGLGFRQEILGNLQEISQATAERYAVTAKSFQRRNHPANMEAVLNILRDNPGIYLDDITTLSSLNKFSVRRWLRDAAEAGQVNIDKSSPIFRYSLV